jgi:hypothetical protein
MSALFTSFTRRPVNIGVPRVVCSWLSERASRDEKKSSGRELKLSIQTLRLETGSRLSGGLWIAASLSGLLFRRLSKWSIISWPRAAYFKYALPNFIRRSLRIAVLEARRLDIASPWIFKRVSKSIAGGCRGPRLLFSGVAFHTMSSPTANSEVVHLLNELYSFLIA